MTFLGFEFLSWVFEVELEVEVSRGGSMWVFKTRSGSTAPDRVKWHFWPLYAYPKAAETRFARYLL